jgi:hypothetical protein
MFNYNLVGLTHVFWMLDFYEHGDVTPAVQPAGMFSQPKPTNGLAGLIAPPPTSPDPDPFISEIDDCFFLI